MQAYFNPRSPCGERLNIDSDAVIDALFQPTLPVRGATASTPLTASENIDFNPRSPCGERRVSLFFSSLLL